MPSGYATTLVTLIPFALLIAAAADADRNEKPSVLRHPWLVWFGTISYCFYLVHQGVVVVLHDLIDSPAPRVALLPVAVLAAWALHRFVEVPAERRLRQTRVGPRRFDSAVAPAAPLRD